MEMMVPGKPKTVPAENGEQLTQVIAGAGRRPIMQAIKCG